MVPANYSTQESARVAGLPAGVRSGQTVAVAAPPLNVRSSANGDIPMISSHPARRWTMVPGHGWSCVSRKRAWLNSGVAWRPWRQGPGICA